MRKAPFPKDEDRRIAELNAYSILDTVEEKEYNDLAYLASQICGMPIALISLVDPERQWFKAAVGLDAKETSRDLAFCSHAILQDDVFVVNDASEDERFHDNPLFTGEPHVQFYAGAPLKTPTGQKIGTICVIDNKPNDLSEEQKEALQALSRQVITQLELRKKLLLEISERALLSDFSDMLLEIHRLNCKQYDNAEELFADYLESGLKILRLDFGIVSRIEGDSYYVEGVQSPAGEISVGDKYDVVDTYCAKVVESKQTICFEKAAKYPDLLDHPVYINMKLESFISTPLWVRGKIYGTLNFSSQKIRANSFVQTEVHFVETLGQAIASRFEIWLAQEELKNQLDTISKLEKDLAIEKLSGGVAHEINNPLNIIRASTELIERGLGEGIQESVAKRIGVINSMVDRISNIVQSLVLFSEKEQMADIKKQNINDIIQNTVSLLMSEFELNSLDLDWVTKGENVQAYCNASQLNQVLLKIFSNCMDALEGVSAPTIKISSELKDGFLYTTISDNGHGISSKDIERIFDPFYSTRDTPLRAGLGLSVARGMLKIAGGDISASMSDGWTHICFRLPQNNPE